MPKIPRSAKGDIFLCPMHSCRLQDNKKVGFQTMQSLLYHFNVHGITKDHCPVCHVPFKWMTLMAAHIHAEHDDIYDVPGQTSPDVILTELTYLDEPYEEYYANGSAD